MKKERRNDKYFNIPKKLILEEEYKKLSSDAKLVYAYITTENAKATLEEVAGFLGMSEQAVEKALEELRANGQEKYLLYELYER